MCHLHISTLPCGCRDESRVIVCDRLARHRAHARCFEMLSCRPRRRRWCARHHPKLNNFDFFYGVYPESPFIA